MGSVDKIERLSQFVEGFLNFGLFGRGLVQGC